MRWADGSVTPVQWAFTDPDAAVMELDTPYRSGHYSAEWPFDTGLIGEIAQPNFSKSTAKLPPWVARCCRVGADAWWGPDGWPNGTPGVTLVDGWAQGCGGGAHLLGRV